MMRRSRLLSVLLVGVLALALTACGGGGAGDTVKIGALFDLSGATADVGVPHAEGVRAYIDYINSKGGVGGRTIELVEVDYAYNVDNAREAYKRFINEDRVVAMFGWGTGDTEALKELISKDKIPFTSGSFSESLANPAQTPYNFLMGSTYSQQARIALEWVKGQKPGARVAMVFNDTAFGRSPLEDAKSYAAGAGLQWVGEVVVDLNAADAITQVLELDRLGAEYVLIQETTNATAVTLKSAQQQGLLGKMQFIGLAYSTDENLVKAAGAAAEGFVGVPPFGFPYEDVAGRAELEEYLKSRGQTLDGKTQKFIQGWSFGKVMVEGIRRAGETVTGETIKAGLESLQDFDLGGFGSPVTFTGTDHAGAKRGRVYKVTNGRWEPVSDWIQPQG